MITLCRGSDESEIIFVSLTETIRVPLSILVDMKITAMVSCESGRLMFLSTLVRVIHPDYLVRSNLVTSE